MVKYVYRFRGRNAGAPGAVPGAPETPLAFLDSCFLFSVPIGGFPPHADSILRLVSPSGDSSSGVLHLRCVSQTGRPGPSRERRPLRACARPPPELRARGSAAGSGWSPGRPGCARGPFDNCCRSKKTLFHTAPSLKSFSPNPHLKGSETSLGEGSLRTLGTDAWGSPKLDPPRAGRFHGNRG